MNYSTRRFTHYRSFLRLTRNADVLSESYVNQTMDVIAQTIRFENVSDGITYGFSRDVFETKCKDFKAVRNFLNDSINAINEVSEETATSLRNATDIVDELDNFSLNQTISNMSLANIGVDPVIAKSIFNISEDEFNTLIEHGLDNLTNDEYLNDIQSSIRTLKETLQNQTDDANNINSVNQWMLAMESMTTEYFDNEVCVSFLDCSYYCISVLMRCLWNLILITDYSFLI